MLIVLWCSPVLAEVLTFEDLYLSDDNEYYAKIPNAYGGLNWSENFYQLDGSDPVWTNLGYDKGRVSDNHVAFNCWEKDVTVTAPNGRFDFNGAYLTAAWNDGLNIQATGYFNSVLLHDQTVVVDTTGPTWFSFNYLGIDELKFSSSGGTPNPNNTWLGDGTHFVMDNFTFTEPIPEPATMILLGSGLIGVLGLKRKLRK